MENSYRYYKNIECEFYPCHEDIEEINCLFCYCPLYMKEKCPGNPQYLQINNGSTKKDCSKCRFPHEPQNYDFIIKLLSKSTL